MKYSFSFKTADGVTVRSDVVAFESDKQASDHAQAEASKTAIVEVWKGDTLLVRFEQSKISTEPGIAAPQDVSATARRVERGVL